MSAKRGTIVDLPEQTGDEAELEDAAQDGSAETEGLEGDAESPGEAALEGDASAELALDDDTGAELALDDDTGAELALDDDTGAELALDDEALVGVVGAILFASSEPLTVRRIARAADRAGRVEDARVRTALEALDARLVSAGLPIRVRELAGGHQLMTDPAVAEVVRELASERRVERLSPAALETLAVVAYRQPVTKAEIEAIRGVQAGPILRTLIDRDLVKVVGRADQPGSPLQYGTTREFLDRFGLSGLKDLPRDPELLR